MLCEWAGFTLTEVRAMSVDDLIFWLEGIAEIEKARDRAMTKAKAKAKHGGR